MVAMVLTGHPLVLMVGLTSGWRPSAWRPDRCTASASSARRRRSLLSGPSAPASSAPDPVRSIARADRSRVDRRGWAVEDRVERWGDPLGHWSTDDQRALLDVSTRFMEDACPLAAVRDGAWKDDGFAAVLPPAGGRARLVLDARAGGARRRERLGQRRARRRADRLQAGWAAAAGLVRRHERRRRARWRPPAATSCATRCFAPLVAGEVVGVVGRGQRRRRRSARRRGGRHGRPATAAWSCPAPRSRCRTSSRRHGSSSPAASADGPAQVLVAADAPGVTVTRARLARPHPALRRGPLRRGPRCRPGRWSARPARSDDAARPAAGHRRAR